MTKFGSNYYYIEVGEKKTTKLQTQREQQQRINTAFLTFLWFKVYSPI